MVYSSNTLPSVPLEDNRPENVQPLRNCQCHKWHTIFWPSSPQPICKKSEKLKIVLVRKGNITFWLIGHNRRNYLDNQKFCLVSEVSYLVTR